MTIIYNCSLKLPIQIHEVITISSVIKEILNKVNVCKSDGKLNSDAKGWARKPFHSCNYQNSIRKKRWNHWVISNEKYILFLATINTGILKCINFYLYDLENGRAYDFSKKFMIPEFLEFGAEVYSDIKVEKGLFSVEEKNIDEYVLISGRAERAQFDLKIILSREKESLNVVVPWNERVFQFTSKQNCLPVSGKVTIDSKEFIFDEKDSFAALDFGHGKWPYRTHWNWATASGIVDGRSLGLNLGAGWTKGTGINENAVYIDSKVFKITDEIKFSYDPFNHFNPWILETENSDQIDIYFEPKSKKKSKSNFVFFKVNLTQMAGFYHGTIKIDGETFELKDIPGCIEEQYALW